MKKINWTDKSDIRLGFEVECVICGGSNWTKFNNEIRPLRNKLSTGSDGSINTGSYARYLYNGHDGEPKGVEIRTDPLPPKSAMELLEKVFVIVNKYGTTNASCGFHVNISSAKKSKMMNFDPIPFLSSKLWNQILKRFNRYGNSFCYPVIRTKNAPVTRVATIKRIIDTAQEKYRAVTLCNFSNGQQKSSRVEIRAFGNKNYTKKYGTIAGYIKRIEKLFKMSCRQSSLRSFSV